MVMTHGHAENLCEFKHLFPTKYNTLYKWSFSKKLLKFISKLWFALYISSMCVDKVSYLSVIIYGTSLQGKCGLSKYSHTVTNGL